MPKTFQLDKAEIFSLKYIVIMGLIASILALASWIVIAIDMNLSLLQLENAGTYFSNFNQVSAAAGLLSNQFTRFIFGMIFSGLMFLVTIFLFKENSIVIFDYVFSRMQLGIFLILFSLFNLIFGATGFWVGDILGMIAGSFAIINDMYMEDWRFHRHL